jgi:DNA polymerase/3'-5' exonuclease PolX
MSTSRWPAGSMKQVAPCQPTGHTHSLQNRSGKRHVSKIQRPLAEAERIAAAIVADLAPFCARIEIAGSVRRRKEVVGDIELVAIPRYAPAGLFGHCTANLLWEHLHASDAYRFTKGDHPAGRYYQLTLPSHVGMQLDLFLAQPDNWGLTLLVRTGSAAFSTAMLARWKRRQGFGRGQPGSVDGRLVTRDGRVVPTPEEETVFRLLGMPPVPPERRSGVEW